MVLFASKIPTFRRWIGMQNFRGFFIVPYVGRCNAQRFSALILRTHHKRPGKIPRFDPTLLKGSNFFFMRNRRRRKYISFKMAAYLRIKESPATRSQTNTYRLIPLPTHLLPHRTLPLKRQSPSLFPSFSKGQSHKIFYPFFVLIIVQK